MVIKQVAIKNFRGIGNLLWKPPGKLSCLIGRGDSTKTTILEAIELALTNRYDPSFGDVDFFKLDTSSPVEITITIGALPPELLADTKLGLSLRGWEPEGELLDEPQDGSESVLSIRLTVDEHLEPQWVAWTERGERRISATDRSKLGMSRIGANAAWHLVWSRRSALSLATDDIQEAKPHLAQALRTVRSTIGEAPLPGLKDVSERVEDLAKKLGVAPTYSYRPGLNPFAFSLRSGAMSLHDGHVPLTGAGTGTQRLAAIAVQQLAIAEGAILLLDEVELGLEPHRLRHLLQLLRNEPAIGQVLLTSHSPIAIAELRAPELCVVHNQGGSVEVRGVGSELQATVRASAEALLSRSVIVCEGKTEVGLCRAWDREIWQSNGKMPLAQAGTYPIDGMGTNASQRALDLRDLGYRVALFIDADVSLDRRDELKQSGVKIVEWADGLNTEQRLCQDLPWTSFCELVEIASETRGEASVLEAILTKLGSQSEGQDLRSLGLNLDQWKTEGLHEADLRAAVAEAATGKRNEWFKRIDLGETLGEIVAAALGKIPISDLATKIAILEEWAHGD